MRVLMTADCVGGVWTYALNLARALAPRGVRVTLATMGAPLLPAQRRAARAIPGLDLRESLYRLEWQEDPWSDVDRAGAWLLRLASEVRPDVVHLNGYAHAALPWNVPVLVVAHSCVRTWWRSVRREDPPASWSTYTERVGAGLRAASLVLAPTAALIEAMRREYSWPADLARVVPNGCDRAAFAAGDKDPIILTAGRLWDEGKNVAAVCAAARGLAWRVVAAGDAGSHESGDAPVEFLGPLSRPSLATWMSRASIFTLPARYEPFGLSALEAALSGCALVLGDIPTLREVWGDAALYVEPDAAGELAATLRMLCEDDALRARLARAAHARGQRYTSEQMARAYHRVYDELRAGDASTPVQPVERSRPMDSEAACAS